jgi:hypothetical protein
VNEKFNRQYEIAISLPGQTDEFISIANPFTIEFEVIRNLLGSSNKATFRIYNLSPITRDKIRKDSWSLSVIRPIAFKAGYNQKLSNVFVGNISTAFSYREGVDYITQIECFGGSAALTNSFVSKQFRRGATLKTVMRSMLDELKSKGIQPGAVGDYTEELSRGNSFVGNTAQVVQEISGGGMFIDNGKAHILKDDEVLKGELRTITSELGVLETPILEYTGVNLKIIFEPRFIIGQKVALDLKTFQNFNSRVINPRTKQVYGEYKITQIQHSGIISEAVAGSATTSLALKNFGIAFREVGE